ncbi:MAG: hypothetical protein Q8912_05235 [Bacillota bacterium]|nr:hypothetical protein [Bacillota bacterium]
MSNLALKRDSTFVDRLKLESGEKSYPIWLLVNPKFSRVRYDIWNPILDAIQDRVFRKLRRRIETEKIFMRDTMSDIGLVLPKTIYDWEEEVADEIVILRESVLKYQPKMLITFGSVTYEYIRRLLEIKQIEGPKYWRTANLGDEFERSIADFDINRTNMIPLPRHVTSSDKSTDDGNNFSWDDGEIYFRDVGTKIEDRIIENKDSLKIWIE